MYVEQLSRYIRFLGGQLALDFLLGRDLCNFSPPKAFLTATSIVKPDYTSKSATRTSATSPTWVWLRLFFFAHRCAQSFLIWSLFSGDRSGNSLHLFVQTPPCLTQWSCLLLLVASWTHSSCWGGQLDNLYSWGTGCPWEGSCWKSRPPANLTLHCLPPPIACMRGTAPPPLPLPPYSDLIAHYSGWWVMSTALWA